MLEKETTEQVIDAAIEVHRHLGPGLFESVYEECLDLELASRGLRVHRQKVIRYRYKTINLVLPLRADLVVNDLVLLKLKAVEHVLPVHQAQILTSLRLTGYPIGLLMNFNVPVMTQGIRRFTHTLGNSVSP